MAEKSRADPFGATTLIRRLSESEAAQAILTKAFGDVTDITAELRIITPEAAAYLLEHHTYERQRPMRDSSLGNLGYALEGGSFRPATVICFGTHADKTSALDGHHRLTVCRDSEMPIIALVVNYHCRTPQQLHNLYITFDSGVGYRNKADMFVAYYGYETVNKLGRKKLGRLMAATTRVMSMISEDINKATTHNAKLHCMCSYQLMKPMQKLNAIFQQTTGIKDSVFLQQAVLSVALLTMRYKPTQATEFWSAIATADFKGAGDPCHAFREFITLEQRIKDRNSLGSRQGYTPHQVSQIATNCWNHHFRGAKLDSATEGAELGKNAPVFIAGTPFRFKRDSKAFSRALMGLGLGGVHYELLRKYGRVARTKKRQAGAKAPAQLAKEA